MKGGVERVVLWMDLVSQSDATVQSLQACPQLRSPRARGQLLIVVITLVMMQVFVSSTNHIWTSSGYVGPMWHSEVLHKFLERYSGTRNVSYCSHSCLSLPSWWTLLLPQSIMYKTSPMSKETMLAPMSAEFAGNEG